MNPLRGEVWWVSLDPTRGSEINKTRPCVVVSSDVLNRKRRTVVAIPLSTSPVVQPPITIAVISDGKHAVAVVDQIRATAKERFSRKIGVLTYRDMEAIEAGIRDVLAMG